ncbi:MarR family transcriptional regulator [Nocardioides mangrovicus]|uniref:MarR family transcriptional regulator n=1 Tax=Nocardioides mangrovicus TaxID=2478913 RepID=A0A3L8NXX3_9ACTN|nr:MarR family transcriptional regulator [Nocardioides mangrovicus]RLV47532.1 MarR family transcriptional regulator [Nocardioides mangrovicus]
MADVDPLTHDWAPAQVAVMQALGEWSAGFEELSRRQARWLGLPTNDAHALGQVVWAAESGTPLSPGELSRRLGMTTGATTVLVDRLERAGLLRRARESADRRRVTLHPTPAARERTHAFLTVAGTEIAGVLAEASPRDLATIARFLARLVEATEAANHRLAHSDPEP